MNYLVDLRLGWGSKLVMSAKDFVALSEILERSSIVETKYVIDVGYVAISDGDRECQATAEAYKKPVYTPAQFQSVFAPPVEVNAAEPA